MFNDFNKKFFDFEFLYKVDYVISHLLDHDLFVSLADSKKIRKDIDSLYKIFSNIIDENERSN